MMGLESLVLADHGRKTPNFGSALFCKAVLASHIIANVQQMSSYLFL